MNDTVRPFPANSTSGPGSTPPEPNDDKPKAANSDASRAVLAGVIGGIASAVGYLVYARLPDDQKERLHGQVRGLVESRINEIRSNLNL